jgi:hypothetical protein
MKWMSDESNRVQSEELEISIFFSSVPNFGV